MGSDGSGGGGLGRDPNRQGSNPLGSRLPLGPPPRPLGEPDEPYEDPEDDHFDPEDDRVYRGAKKVKDAGEVKLPSPPTGQAFRAWRMLAIHTITTAAGRHDDKAMDWVLKAERVTSTDDLDHPGR